ncbi:BTAD domain-containing putative transcriptional regulator [Kitasatospora sp. MMS16-BH015]|uniref:AfsR/SARP family transcriptional regulator n=1 Tax=Kitasatospora sp. MMS16-BH015 TaxID=2018025 RepID=UPI00131A5F2A|nr:BTAD domain-containing putative transcriptional regulator [Kitasatospora sp. MMS16-BH015]
MTTGEGPVVVTGDRQRNLLATLLVHGGATVPFDALADAVWDGQPPCGARSALHTCLARLRRQLGPAAAARIVHQAPGYRFELLPGELDLHQVDDAAASGRRAAARGEEEQAYALLTEAAALCAGAPLADVPSEVLREQWAEPLRQRLLAVRLDQVDSGLRLGLLAEVLPTLLALRQQQPLDERVHERLMLALHRDGRTSDALAAFRHARQLLVRELGVEPGPALQRLHHRILAAAEGPPEPAGPTEPPTAAAPEQAPTGPPAPAQLPPALTDFTGRTPELHRLARLLGPDRTGPDAATDRVPQQRSAQEPQSPPPEEPGAPGVPVVVVSGCGGLGKSALAVQAAHRLRPHYPDGQLYATFASHSGRPRTTGEVLAGFLAALGTPAEALPKSDEDRAAHFRSLVADRRLLLLLDDAPDAAAVRPLLPGGAGCGVLVTSRDRLSGLSGALLLDLDLLPREQARALLGRVAGADRLAAEPEAAERILDACAGLPLALRIVGARLVARPGWSLAHLAARLADERGRLGELRAGDLAVGASFAVSYTSVGAADAVRGSAVARAFRLLGLVSGPTIGLSTASALLDRPVPEVEEAMEHLVDAHLLESTHPGRYRFHDLLRVYARGAAEQQERADDREEAVHRLLTFFREGTAAAAAQLNPGRRAVGTGPAEERWSPFPDRTAALRWLDAEHENLVAAARQSAELGLDGYTWELARNLAQYFMLGGHVDDHIDTHRLALTATQRLGDRAAEHICSANLAAPYWQLGRFQEALETLEHSLELTEELGDTQGEANCLLRIGLVQAAQDDHASAVETYRRALPVLRTLERRNEEANLLGNLGHALAVLGRSGEALETLREAVALAREIGDRRNEATALVSIGQLLCELRQPGEALDQLRAGLAAAREAGDLSNEAEALTGLGEAFRQLDLTAPAEQHVREALEILEHRLTRPDLHAEAVATLAGIRRAALPTGG